MPIFAHINKYLTLNICLWSKDKKRDLGLYGI